MKTKNGTGQQKPRKVPHMIYVLVVAVPALLILMMSRWETRNDAEHIIAEKISRELITSRFTPVEIYRLDKDSAFFAGSGSLFVGSNGEQIITSEHLFRKELGSPIFAFRKLRPLESEITHGINAIIHKGADLAVRPGELPDVAIVRTGITNPIECYSDRTLLVSQDQGEISKAQVATVVRSLVSGESVHIIGIMKSTHDAGTQYVIMEYASISGESGTGFVDQNDQLWVLKGIPDWSGEAKVQVEKLLGTTHELSVAYGPFQFRK